MREDIGKQTQARLQAKFADTVFGELDGIVALEREAEEKIERLTAELSGIRAQKDRVIKIIKDAGLRRTGSASPDGSADTEPTTVSASVFASAEETKTIKQMILAVVTEAGEDGIRPVEIGHEIKRRYHRDVASGLHTQIARLSKEGKIRRQGEGWKLSQKNAG
jgi:hypothetical protein